MLGRVHRVMANPFTSVTLLTGVTEPALAGTTQVTCRPPMPLPLSSRSRTTRSSATSNPPGAIWSSPETSSSTVGLAGTAVWVKVTGEPVNPSTVARADTGPAVGPSTRSAAARPASSVSTVTGSIEPPPVTDQVTSTPSDRIAERVGGLHHQRIGQSRVDGAGLIVAADPDQDAARAGDRGRREVRLSSVPVEPPRAVLHPQTAGSPSVGPSVQAAAASPVRRRSAPWRARPSHHRSR